LLVTVNKRLNLKSKSFTTYRVTLYYQIVYELHKSYKAIDIIKV